MSARTWIVVLSNPMQPHVYLGELDRGVRQGVRQLHNAVRFTRVGAVRVAVHYRGARVLDASLPACALTMGCLCAFHARGAATEAACNASESAVPCDRCGHENDRADAGNYCTPCRDGYNARHAGDPEYRPVGSAS